MLKAKGTLCVELLRHWRTRCVLGTEGKSMWLGCREQAWAEVKQNLTMQVLTVYIIDFSLHFKMYH